jgi:hypothetical protein
MPVWGARFYAETHDERRVRAMISELVAYLQSIQTAARADKPIPAVPQGAQPGV